VLIFFNRRDSVTGVIRFLPVRKKELANELRVGEVLTFALHQWRVPRA
jgi:hypothetical protein